MARPYRSASPAVRSKTGPSSSSSLPIAAGVALDGARGEVWRAVAMQAHLLGPPPGRRSLSLGSGIAMRGQQRPSSSERTSSASRRTAAPPTAAATATATTRNAATTAATTAGTATAARPAATSTTTTTRTSGSASARTERAGLNAYAELEYAEKLKRHQASLSLAQRLGLVARPSEPLTAEQWEAVKKASDTRADSEIPCSICLDDFMTRPQLILSCSHVFHGECLRSFERFSGTRRCPLCRCPSYDATPHFGGFQVWRRKCASRIQKAWRGHRQRSLLYQRLSKDGDKAQAPVMHRKFCGRALKVAGDKLERACHEREDALERFLRELDESVGTSADQLRAGLMGLEAVHGGGEGRALAALFGGDPSPKGAQTNGHQDASPVQTEEQAMWAKAREAAASRGDEIDCPICFQECSLSGPNAARVELLSCSHVFHRCCLASFESFHVFERHICPVCRQHYERRPWVEPEPGAHPPISAGAVSDSALPSSLRSGSTSEARLRPPRPPRPRQALLAHQLPDQHHIPHSTSSLQLDRQRQGQRQLPPDRDRDRERERDRRVPPPPSNSASHRVDWRVLHSVLS